MNQQDWLERTLPRTEETGVIAEKRYPYIMIYSGNDTGKRFPLQFRKMTVGRAPDVDVILNDVKVSKLHCTIEFTGKQIVIEDNGSTNGVFVNGERITRHVLTGPANIQIGDTGMKIDFKDPEELKFEDDLIRKATTDPLSAILNRAFFEKRAREELSFARRGGLPVGLAMIDIDFFKVVNDTYGHQTGDYAIGQIARLMYAKKRTEDILARFGGEEFTIFIRGTESKDNALALCERLRQTVEAFTFSFNNATFHLTISIGLWFGKAESSDSLDLYISRSDAALYKAKYNGRNRVVFFSENM